MTVRRAFLPAFTPGMRAMAIGAFWFGVMGLLVKLAGRVDALVSSESQAAARSIDRHA